MLGSLGIQKKFTILTLLDNMSTFKTQEKNIIKKFSYHIIDMTPITISHIGL